MKRPSIEQAVSAAMTKYDEFSKGFVLTERGLLHRYLELSKYTSMTAEAAKLLVVLERFGGTFGFSDFTGIEELDYGSAVELSKIMGQLELPAIKKLLPEVATGFVDGKYAICFDGVTELSTSTARELAKRTGAVRLQGLSELSEQAAAAFENSQLELDLSGLTRLSDAAAASLSKHEGNLSLNGVTEISATAIRSLSCHRGTVELRGLTQLSDEAASALSEALVIMTDYVHFSQQEAVDAIPEPQRARLGRNQHREIKRLLDERTLESVTEACRQLNDLEATDGDWLACFSAGRLEKVVKKKEAAFVAVIAKAASSMVNVTSELMNELCRIDDNEWLIQELFLDEDSRVSSVVAGFDVRFPWVEMTDTLARRLINHQGKIVTHRNCLPTGMQPTTVQLDLVKKAVRCNQHWIIDDKEIPIEFVEIISRCSGNLRFTFLEELSEEFAVAAGKHRGGDLSFNEVTYLSDEAAKGLSHHVGDLALPKLKTLSPNAARSLAKNKGTLWLEGIVCLDPELAEAFATSTYDLQFQSITALTVEAAAALAGHTGKLCFAWGFKELSCEIAEALSHHQGVLDLGHVSSLSLEAAAAISQHRGTVRLMSAHPFSLEVATLLANSPGTMLVSLNAIEDYFPDFIKCALSR